MRKILFLSLILATLATAHQTVNWQVQEKSPDCKSIPFIEDGVQKVAAICPAILVFTTDTTKATEAPQKAK